MAPLKKLVMTTETFKLTDENVDGGIIINFRT